MNTFLVVFIVAIVAVALMFIGLSLTQMIKRRPLQSEVGENDEMKKRGLKCAKQEFMEEEMHLRGKDGDLFDSCNGSCGSCSDGCNDSYSDKPNDSVTDTNKK